MRFWLEIRRKNNFWFDWMIGGLEKQRNVRYVICRIIKIHDVSKKECLVYEMKKADRLKVWRVGSKIQEKTFLLSSFDKKKCWFI